jgi:hypothetical protein
VASFFVGAVHPTIESTTLAKSTEARPMIFIEIHALWNGRPIEDDASVTKLADDLEDQQKQIATLALQKMCDTPPCAAPNERAADFARRLGFTRLDYHYQENDTWMVVDVLQPSPAAPGNSSFAAAN